MGKMKPGNYGEKSNKLPKQQVRTVKGGDKLQQAQSKLNSGKNKG